MRKLIDTKSFSQITFIRKKYFKNSIYISKQYYLCEEDVRLVICRV